MLLFLLLSSLLLLFLLLLLCPGNLIRHVLEIMTNADKPCQTHTLKPVLLNMQTAELCDVAHSHFDIYEALWSLLFLFYNTPKKSCKINYKEYFTSSYFPILKNLLMNVFNECCLSIADNLWLSRDRRRYKIIIGVNIAEKKITLVTEAEISIIRSFKLKNSTGYDEVPSRILKHHAPEIRKPLCYVCNSSLQFGIYLERKKRYYCWKCSFYTNW